MAFKPMASLGPWGPSSTVETHSFGGNGIYQNNKTVVPNLTNGQLYRVNPISTGAEDQSVYVPVNDILPTDDWFLEDSEDLIFGPDGTLGGTPSSSSSSSSTQATTPAPAPTPPSTRPYIWKYQ